MNATAERADKFLTDRHPGHEASYALTNRSGRYEVRCACGEVWQQRGPLRELLAVHALHVRSWWYALDAWLGA